MISHRFSGESPDHDGPDRADSACSPSSPSGHDGGGGGGHDLFSRLGLGLGINGVAGGGGGFGSRRGSRRGSFRTSSQSIASNLDKIFDGNEKDKTVRLSQNLKTTSDWIENVFF